MSDTVAGEGVAQGLGDGFLADEIIELLRPIPAGDDRVFGLRLRH